MDISISNFNVLHLDENGSRRGQTPPKSFEDQKPLDMPDYLCGYVRARVVVARQEGISDIARVTLVGLGKDFDPWLAWGECTIELLSTTGAPFATVKDYSKPSQNPHWLVDRRTPENPCGEFDVTAPTGLYDLIGGIRLTVLRPFHCHR